MSETPTDKKEKWVALQFKDLWHAKKEMVVTHHAKGVNGQIRPFTYFMCFSSDELCQRVSNLQKNGLLKKDQTVLVSIGNTIVAGHTRCTAFDINLDIG